jgi:hypothetical protein
MNPRFEPEVEEVLRAAGWFPGRKASEEELQAWDAMRPLFPAARRALEEFAGLYVEARGNLRLDEPDEAGNPRWNPNYRSSFCIDPVAACEDYGNAEMDDYEKFFGCRMWCIGFNAYSVRLLKNGKKEVSGQDHFLMDEHGRMFLVDYDDTLVGDSIEQALHNLITATGMQYWDVKNDVPDTRKHPLQNGDVDCSKL